MMRYSHLAPKHEVDSVQKPMVLRRDERDKLSEINSHRNGHRDEKEVPSFGGECGISRFFSDG
jgi:hypothetical protein